MGVRRLAIRGRCVAAARARLFGGALLGTLVLALSACASAPADAPHPTPRAGREGLLLVAHGYGNNPGHWPARLIERIVAVEPRAEAWDIYAHDWEREANRPLTAARRGYRIGERLAADLLAAGDPYPVVHLVGQSLGAHLVQGFLDEYRFRRGNAAVHVTFLDPFALRGLLGFGWGVRAFGRGADFAECYIVRREPALGTNRYLRRAHNFDITAVVPVEAWDEFIGPHWWVVQYYRQSVGSARPGVSLAPMVLWDAGDAARYRSKLDELQTIYPPGEVTEIGAGREADP